jgi:hypothetical protein
MDTNHIQNALNKLNRGEMPGVEAWIKIFENELAFRIQNKYGE